MAQERISLGLPLHSTTHIPHAPYGLIRSSWQRVGISAPAFLAASSSVEPFSIFTLFPSTVNVIYSFIVTPPYFINIASKRHATLQLPHFMHLPLSILCGFFTSPDIAPTGHFLLHSVHPRHLSESM